MAEVLQDETARLRQRVMDLSGDGPQVIGRWLAAHAEAEGLPVREDGRPDVGAWPKEHRDRLEWRITAEAAARHCPEWGRLDGWRQKLAQAIAADVGLDRYPIDRGFAASAELEQDALVRAAVASLPLEADLTDERIAGIIARANADGVATLERWVDAVRAWADVPPEQPPVTAVATDEDDDRWGRLLAAAYEIRQQVDAHIAAIEAAISDNDDKEQ